MRIDNVLNAARQSLPAIANRAGPNAYNQTPLPKRQKVISEANRAIITGEPD
jgi:hypothetical protein